MKLKKTRLARAIALTVAGGALSFGVAGTASAHTMYNTFVGASAADTDGWNYGQNS